MVIDIDSLEMYGPFREDCSAAMNYYVVWNEIFIILWHFVFIIFQQRELIE